MKKGSIFDWFIPEEIRDDVDNYRRAYLLVGFCLAGLVSKTASVLSAEFRPMDGILLVAILVAPFTLRLTRHTSLGGNLLVGGFMIALVEALFFYGPTYNILRWIINVVPISGFLLLSFRYSLFWALFSGATLFVTFGLFHNGYWGAEILQNKETFSGAPFVMVDMTLNFVAVTIVGVLLERGKNQAFRRLDKALLHSENLSDHLRETMIQVEQSSTQIANSSDNLLNLGSVIREKAYETSDQAGSATQESHQISEQNMGMIGNLSSLSDSIEKIGQRSEMALKVAVTAVNRARETSRTMDDLGNSSKQIAEVSKVIFSIAKQTNLLSLNAAIEASKAGDAGKGFAVVAESVKTLSLKTTQATTDISDRVTTIQDDVESAINAIFEINEIIEKIEALQKKTTVTVNEQKASSTEINHIAANIGARMERLDQNIQHLSQSAEVTSTSVVEMLAMARELAKVGHQLQEMLANEIPQGE